MEVHLLTDEELLAALPASELEPPQDRAAAEHEESEQKAQSGISEELVGCVSSQWTIVILRMLRYAAQCLCPGPIALPLFD